MEKQWEIGKTYKLVDVEGFRQDESAQPTNNVIADILQGFDYTFTVVALNENFQVIATDNLSVQSLESYVLFNSRDLPRVEIITRVTPKDPVVEWLDKYCYVTCVDGTVGEICVDSDRSLYIHTDHGDITDTQAVVDFINNRYDLLQKEAKTSKQKELAEKKAKLLEELSAIEKELEGV